MDPADFDLDKVVEELELDSGNKGLSIKEQFEDNNLDNYEDLLM